MPTMNGRMMAGSISAGGGNSPSDTLAGFHARCERALRPASVQAKPPGRRAPKTAPRPVSYRYTPEERADVIRRGKAGEPLVEIARSYGRGATSLAGILHAAGVKVTPSARVTQRSVIEKLMLAGMPRAEIKTTTGACATYLRSIRNDLVASGTLNPSYK